MQASRIQATRVPACRGSLSSVYTESGTKNSPRHTLTLATALTNCKERSSYLT